MEQDPFQIKSELELRFEQIQNELSFENIEIEESSRQQHKFFLGHDLETVRRLKKRLFAMDAFQIKPPLDQWDTYFLTPGANPTFQTQTLCLRIENSYTNFDDDSDSESVRTGMLIYKSNAFAQEISERMRVRVLKSDDDEIIEEILKLFLEETDGFDQYDVNKTRTIYQIKDNEAPLVSVYIDEDVELSTAGYLGTFVEIASEDEDAIELVKAQLGIEGHAFDVPYIDGAKLLQKVNSEAPNKTVEIDKENNRWLGLPNYKPYYFDAQQSKFTVGVSPRLLKGMDESQIREIEDEIEKIARQFIATPHIPSGPNYPYKQYPNHDGFIRLPHLSTYFKNHMLYRKDFNWGQRIDFSRVKFHHNNEQGIFIHKIGDHDAHERWLSRHLKR